MSLQVIGAADFVLNLFRSVFERINRGGKHGYGRNLSIGFASEIGIERGRERT